MKKTLTVHQPRICVGPQRPLTMPAFGLRAQEPRPMTFHDPDKGGTFKSGVAKAMDAESDPDKALAAGIRAAGEDYERLMKSVDQWHKDTKQAAEDLTKVKNAFDGLDSTVKAFDLAMQKLRLQFSRERSMAFGDPIERIQNNEEARTLLNALVRSYVSANSATQVRMSDRHKEVIKGLTEGSSPGSLTIQSQLDMEVYSLLQRYGIWNTLDVRPLSTLSTLMRIQTADPLAQFIDEAGAISDDSNIAGSTVTATVKKIAVALSLSRELLQDSEFDITREVLEQFANAIAYRADWAAFRADGTADATDGSATGVFEFGTLITAATGNSTMELLDFEDITSVQLGTAVEVGNRSPRWWMHRFILTRLLHIKDANGRPIFLTAVEAPSIGGIGSILGAPVTLGNICPSTNSASQKVMAYGDPGAFRVGVRQGTEIASSEHVSFLNDLITWRGISRMAFKGKLATGFGVLRTAA